MALLTSIKEHCIKARARRGRILFFSAGPTAFPGLHHARIGLCCLCLVLIASGCALRDHRRNIEKEIRARMDLASSYLANEQPRLALRQLKAVERHRADDPEFHYLYGLTSARLKREQEAKEHFQESVQLRPDFAQAWNNLGKVFLSLGEEDKAEQAFTRTLDIPTYLTPELPAYRLARLYTKQGRLDKAEDMARQSLEANPGFAPAISLLAQLLTESGKVQEAVDVLSQGLEVHPDNIQLMLELAENLLRLGRQDQARQWFERIAHTADPKSEASQVAADYLELLPEGGSGR